MKRSNLHRVTVRGVGRLAIKGKLPKYRKTVLVEGKEYPITKQDFMEAWALSHRTGRSFKDLLAERITVAEPKVKLSPFEQYEQNVGFGYGGIVNESKLRDYFQRGFTAEQAVNALRAADRARDADKRGK